MIKRLQLLVLFLVFSVSSFAQAGSAGNWGGGVDDQILHFGFNFQYIASEYKVYKQVDWQRPYLTSEPGVNPQKFTQPLNSISSPLSPGFGLGFVSNLRLGNNSDLRFTPALVFSDRLINYTYQTGDPIQKKIQTTMVELPLGFKLKSDRRLNFRAYLLAGGKYSMDIVSNKKTDDTDKILLEKFVKNNKGILSYEVAVGFDFYFAYFKLSPELKLANSIGNVLKAEAHPFSSPLEKLYTRNFIFSLYFE